VCCQRFLEHARQIRVTSAPDEALVACSAGYTEITEGDTVAEFVKRADQALYKAKGLGRNRAVFLPTTDASE